MAYSFGWRRDLEDHPWLVRSQVHFNTSLYRGYRLPDSVDPRSHLTIKNQQQLGSCSGASRSLLEELLNYIKTQGTQVTLSMMYCYLCNQKECGCFGSDNGATISGSVQAAGKWGVCLEATFPYTGSYTTDIPQAAITEGQPHIINSHAVLNSYDDVFHYLATGTGVVQIGIPVGQAFQGCTGVLDADSAQQDAANPEGGHALALVGYTARKDSQGRNYIILVNSWGQQWANQGTCEVDPACFDFWTSQQGGDCEVIGMSDLDQYGPPDDGRLKWVEAGIYV